MSAWKLKAIGVDGEGTVNNTDNTVTFDAETDKGLTVSRVGNTIKYGINVDSLANNITSNVVTNINNGKTAITNISTGFTVSDGNNKPVDMAMTKDKKPNLQFVYKDEDTEVTAEKTDDGTKVTIGLSAAAQQGLANQDLNFAGKNGTGKVNLKTQTLSITGDADGIISTTATGQGLSMTVDKEKLASTVTNTINNNTNATAITNISAKFSVTDGKNTKAVNLGKGKNNNVKFVGEAGKIKVAVGGDNDAPTVTVTADADLGKNIDISGNTAITNINKTLKANKATVVAGDYVTVTTTPNAETGNTFTVKGPKITGEGSVSVSDIKEGGKKVGYKITGKNTTLAKGTSGLSVADGKLKLNVADTDNNTVTGEVDLKTLDLSGNTTINNLDTKIENITKTGGLLDKKADKDAGNIGDVERTAWATKLGTGKVEADNANLVTGKTVYDFVNPVKTQAETNKADIATLQKGFTLKDSGTGSTTVKAESTVTVTGDTYVKATVNDKGLTLGLNEDALNSQINTQITSNSTVTGKMDSWQLAAKSTDDGEKIDNTNNKAVFDVTEADKGLTVTRDKNTIKYGIDADKLASTVTNSINNTTNATAITNISAKFSVTDGANTKAVNLGKGKNNNVKFVGEAGKIKVAVGGDNDAPTCLLYTSPSPRDLSTSRMPSSA